jgi:sodium/hydrogen antiporter
MTKPFETVHHPLPDLRQYKSSTMIFTLWAIIIGLLLISMTVTASWVERLPLSPAMLYLVAGAALGPSGIGLLLPDPKIYGSLLERCAEIAVLISIFVTALKISVPLRDSRWRLPISLATVAMVVTISLITAVGVSGLDLPLGAALLLGAILAPTDPVLASDVQLEHARDRDTVRFSLTGEGGLNDAAAYPFVLLGLGLLGAHSLGPFGRNWLALDLLWSSIGGLAIGWSVAAFVAKLMLHLRTRHQVAVGLNEFVALGLIALVYGLATIVDASGFLAVFAAGIALPRMRALSNAEANQQTIGETPGASVEVDTKEALVEASATHPVRAPAHLAHAVLSFDEQLERFAEVAMVLVVGAMLSYAVVPSSWWWFVPLLLVVIRPLSVVAAGAQFMVGRGQLPLIAWFGIRGIGSIYYLLFAMNRGLPEKAAQTVFGLTLATVVCSIVVHGISITPLMGRYQRARNRGRHRPNDLASSGASSQRKPRRDDA